MEDGRRPIDSNRFKLTTRGKLEPPVAAPDPRRRARSSVRSSAWRIVVDVPELVAAHGCPDAAAPAQVMTPVVTLCLRSVEAATTGRAIAAQLAGSDAGNNSAASGPTLPSNTSRQTGPPLPSACLPQANRPSPRDASMCAFGQAAAAIDVESLTMCDLRAREPLERPA